MDTSGLKSLTKGDLEHPESSYKERATRGSGMQASLLSWKGTCGCNKYLHLPLRPPSPCPADVNSSRTQPEARTHQSMFMTSKWASLSVWEWMGGK